MARNSYDSDELLTMSQVADYTGYKYWYIRALKCKAETTVVPFPEPDTTIGRRPLWAEKTICAWIKSHKGI